MTRAGRPSIALHFRAPQDRNGNARRVFVVFDQDGGILDAIDEGCEGVRALRRQWPKVPLGIQVSVSVGEYREFLRHGRD